MKSKKIIFLTGTRADFGKLRPLIDKVEKSKNFECYVFVTGMHTLERYDFTYREVTKRGYKNVFVFMNHSQTFRQDIILSNTVVKFGGSHSLSFPLLSPATYCGCNAVRRARNLLPLPLSYT